MREIIDLLPYFVAIFICTIFLDLCYAKLNNVKLNLTKKNFLVVFITVLLTIINNMYVNYELKIIFTLIIMSLNYKLIFKEDIKKTVLSFMFIYIFMLVFEIIVSNCIESFYHINNYDVAYLTYIKLSLSVIIGLAEYLLFIIKPINNILKAFLNFSINYVNTVNISILMFLTVSIVAILNIRDFAKDGTTVLICLLTFIFAILFAFVIKSKYNEESLKSTNEKLINYNDKYGKFLDEYKIYKHNIKHKLSAIKSYGNKKVNSLIDDLLEEETTFSVKNNNLYNVPNGIKGIVAEKLYNANFNVLIDNKIRKDPFKDLSPKAFNSISESIGIALDNAIEASSETDNPIITMDLKENKENIYIKIGNNFCNHIDIDKLGTKYYSTKNRGSGLGLFSIMRNRLVKEKINIINDFYYIELQIKKAR